MSKMKKIKFLSDIEIAGTMTVGESKAEILTKDDLATPDWNQMDPKATSYIKNKTHGTYEGYVNKTIDVGQASKYAEKSIILYRSEMYPSDDGDWKEYAYDAIELYKIANIDIETVSLSSDQEEIVSFSEDGYEFLCGCIYKGDYVIYNSNPSLEYAIKVTRPDTLFISPFFKDEKSGYGEYYVTEIKEPGLYMTNTISLKNVPIFESKVLQLDEKYIPDTIARKSDVETAVNSLVDTAPDALNTLNELSKALGDDPNFSTTVLTQIGKKVDKVNGKGLSTNDYTTVEKNKLAGIETGAQKNVLGDWAENDKTAANYIRNRTHYIEESKTELTYISLFGNKTYSGSTGAEEWKITTFLNQEEENTLRALLNDNDCYLEYSSDIGYYSHKICNCSSNDPSREFTIILEDGYEITIGFGPEAEIPFNSPDQLPKTLKITIELFNDDTYESVRSFAVRIYQKEKIQKLDSKFLPIPSNYFQPIDLFTKLNITSSLATDWPKSDEAIMNCLNQCRWKYWVKENLFTQLFDLFKNYPGFLPTFIISPPKTDKGGIYQLVCSTERIELDSYGATGSPTHPDFNFIYLINLSKDNYLELKFNYDQFAEYPIDLDNFNLDGGNISLIFSLIPKGGNITTEQVAKLAQEQIITPALTEEVY